MAFLPSFPGFSLAHSMPIPTILLGAEKHGGGDKFRWERGRGNSPRPLHLESPKAPLTKHTLAMTVILKIILITFTHTLSVKIMRFEVDPVPPVLQAVWEKPPTPEI